ncbi:hypothetical protein [Pelotomaculum sp. FP]|uniref:hypothetical protein n=1 Tax=Pelotomaculum sp. FP TaxID=261474 RepID=UPI00186545C4|nr:hypothetical protein [Pelotomaculum sp. FP]
MPGRYRGAVRHQPHQPHQPLSKRLDLRAFALTFFYELLLTICLPDKTGVIISYDKKGSFNQPLDMTSG